jgi:hypothetical protein
MVAECEERRDVPVGAQDDVAALAAITAVGSALGHVRLAPERDRARATVPAAQVHLHLVDEVTHEARIRTDAFLSFA